MEGLSNGSLLERMEFEYGLMLSTAATSSNFAATSKQIESSELSSSSVRQPCKVPSFLTPSFDQFSQLFNNNFMNGPKHLILSAIYSRKSSSFMVQRY